MKRSKEESIIDYKVSNTAYEKRLNESDVYKHKRVKTLGNKGSV